MYSEDVYDESTDDRDDYVDNNPYDNIVKKQKKKKYNIYRDDDLPYDDEY